MEKIGQELKEGNFNGIITDYEKENGEIPLMYREPRGSIYHPHTGQTITLGTLMVEQYTRPKWLYNTVVYIEKEGFSEALKDEQWPERHDCMLMSSKGYTTRAARDLIDALAVHNEPVTVFCVHDADAWGTMIYQTFDQETKARGARKIRIINIGLEPWEAEELGLGVEDVEEGKKNKPVANYVRKHDEENGTDWEQWLKSHRTELNAFTTPRFIEWLDEKMEPYKKLVPPNEVIAAQLETEINEKLSVKIQKQILREGRFEERIAEAKAAIERPDAGKLKLGIEASFGEERKRAWRDHIREVAENLTTESEENG
jgi:hypothetical protein